MMDCYDEISGHLDYLEEQVFLIDIAIESDFEIDSLVATLMEMSDRIRKIKELKKKWFGLSVPERKPKAA